MKNVITLVSKTRNRKLQRRQPLRTSEKAKVRMESKQPNLTEEDDTLKSLVQIHSKSFEEKLETLLKFH